ncbi:MAG: hypothetical protein HW387_47 [Parachlamydiales bacterium]|nr:hypothetical protein [Parachlamydiales bacterium]
MAIGFAVKEFTTSVCKGYLASEILKDVIKDETKDTIRAIFKNAIRQTPGNVGRVFHDLKCDVHIAHDRWIDLFQYIKGNKTEGAAPFRSSLIAIARIFLRTLGTALALGALGGATFCSVYIITLLPPFHYLVVLSVSPERIAILAIESITALLVAHGCFTLAKIGSE